MKEKSIELLSALTSLLKEELYPWKFKKSFTLKRLEMTSANTFGAVDIVRTGEDSTEVVARIVSRRSEFDDEDKDVVRKKVVSGERLVEALKKGTSEAPEALINQMFDGVKRCMISDRKSFFLDEDDELDPVYLDGLVRPVKGIDIRMCAVKGKDENGAYAPDFYLEIEYVDIEGFSKNRERWSMKLDRQECFKTLSNDGPLIQSVFERPVDFGLTDKNMDVLFNSIASIEPSLFAAIEAQVIKVDLNKAKSLEAVSDNSEINKATLSGTKMASRI